MIQYDYTIDGTVNRLDKVEGRGMGTTDPDTGETTLTVHFDPLPEHWDPRTIIMMCCLRSLVMGSREINGAIGMYRASGGYLTIGHHIPMKRGFTMVAEDGEVLVRGEASSITDFRPDRGADASSTDCYSKLVPGVNGIARLRPFDGLMHQAGPNLVVVTTVFTAEMEDGRLAHGTTHYPHWLPEPKMVVPGPQLLRCTKVEQTLENGTLHLVTRTEVEPMTTAAIGHESLLPIGSMV